MATTLKTAKASKKTPAHETHGALPVKPGSMNMFKAFNIKDGYHVDTIAEYNTELEKMTETDLQHHAHEVGVVPVNPRPKLETSLRDKFNQVKASQRPPRTRKVETNPAMKDFMHKWWQGEFGR